MLFYKREIEIIQKHGGENIDTYTLINKHGITFDYKGTRYDARYWANCYGASLNKYIIHPTTDDAVINQIEKELNTKGEL